MAVISPVRSSQRPPAIVSPLHFWHLLSLDAPTVAALWAWFIARTLQLRLPLLAPLAMFIAVWTLYAADRLLDARQLFSSPLHTENLEARHLFHHRHATAFLITIAIASVAIAAILPHLLPEALHLYLVLGGLLISYFVLIHATSSAHRLPKEFAVGLFFAAATFIPTVAHRPDLRIPLIPPALLFAAVCSLNCLFIYAWEHDPNTPEPNLTAHITTRIALRNLPSLAITTTLIGLALTLLDDSAPWPLFAASTLAIAILLTLHTLRRNIHPTTLRAAADLALLTPLLLLPAIAR